MCTVVVAQGLHPAVPLIVAANRDEFLDRPAAPPALLPGEPALFGPRDLRAGGTWMAANRAGVVAALTNAAPPDRKPVPGIASRGEVIGHVLAASSAREAAARAAAAVPGRTRPYYLVLADRDEAFGVTAGDRNIRSTALDPGLHVQENRPLDLGSSAKVKRVRELAAELPSWPSTELVARLHRLLSDHRGALNPLRRLCVHTPVYGTRSTSILLLGDEPQWWFLEGRPCEGEPVRDEGFSAFASGGRGSTGAAWRRTRPRPGSR